MRRPTEEPVSIRVAIADDHSLVRQGLRRYLDMADGIEVIGEASNGQELVDLVDQQNPDIALVDIRMPEMDGLEAARLIRDRFPKVGVIMLTAYDDRQFVVEAVRSGARGYVLKARDAEHLIQTVRLVAGGNMVIDPSSWWPWRRSCPRPRSETARPRRSRPGRSRSSSCSRSGT